MSIFRRPRVTHVVFNVEGTLIENLETVYKKAVDATVKPYGRRASWQLMKDVIEQPTLLDGLDMVVKGCDLPLTTEALADEYAKVLPEVASQTTLMPGALKLLDHFEKLRMPMALYTSLSPTLLAFKTENLSDIFTPGQYFDFMVYEEQLESASSNPFTETIRRFPMKPKPSEVLVFVDNREDVQLAVKAGCRCVIVRPRRQCRQPMTHSPWLESLEDFKPQMFGLQRIKKSY